MADKETTCVCGGDCACRKESEQIPEVPSEQKVGCCGGNCGCDK